jgi:hypothetical protein
MATLAEFTDEIRKDVAGLCETLDPDDDLFPCLMVPRDDIVDPQSGRPTMVLIHVGEFFTGQHGKDAFVQMALPTLIRKFEAKQVALVAPMWMAKMDIPDQAERERVMKIWKQGGVAALPDKYKTEGVMVRISDGETEIAAMADLTRHEGAAPTIEWNAETESIFNSPPADARSEGRMRGGFLIESFRIAKGLSPAMIALAEAALGIGYWMPNPDDTPELFKPEPK